jgi:hypothetical protein
MQRFASLTPGELPDECIEETHDRMRRDGLVAEPLSAQRVPLCGGKVKTLLLAIRFGLSGQESTSSRPW